MDYRTLENESLEAIHACYASAFSNYALTIDSSYAYFEALLKRRDFDPRISMGAYDDKVLVSIILNARQEKNATYAICIGTRTEYQGQGIASEMMNQTQHMLAKHSGIDTYILEVLMENVGARKLYEKMGFLIVRELKSFKRIAKSIKPRNTWEVVRPALVGERFKTPYQPSWYNRDHVIDKVKSLFAYAEVKEHNQTIGYGVLEKKTGSLIVIAVEPKYRRQGIGQAILRNLAETVQTETLSAINVDANAHDAIEFLHAMGFSDSIGQYEMKYAIQELTQSPIKGRVKEIE